jgi:hypothetical protein
VGRGCSVVPAAALQDTQPHCSPRVRPTSLAKSCKVTVFLSRGCKESLRAGVRWLTWCARGAHPSPLVVPGPHMRACGTLQAGACAAPHFVFAASGQLSLAAQLTRQAKTVPQAVADTAAASPYRLRPVFVGGWCACVISHRITVQDSTDHPSLLSWVQAT